MNTSSGNQKSHGISSSIQKSHKKSKSTRTITKNIPNGYKVMNTTELNTKFNTQQRSKDRILVSKNSSVILLQIPSFLELNQIHGMKLNLDNHSMNSHSKSNSDLELIGSKDLDCGRISIVNGNGMFVDSERRTVRGAVWNGGNGKYELVPEIRQCWSVRYEPSLKENFEFVGDEVGNEMRKYPEQIEGMMFRANVLSSRSKLERNVEKVEAVKKSEKKKKKKKEKKKVEEEEDGKEKKKKKKSKSEGKIVGVGLNAMDEDGEAEMKRLSELKDSKKQSKKDRKS